MVSVYKTGLARFQFNELRFISDSLIILNVARVLCVAKPRGRVDKPKPAVKRETKPIKTPQSKQADGDSKAKCFSSIKVEKKTPKTGVWVHNNNVF